MLDVQIYYIMVHHRWTYTNLVQIFSWCIIQTVHIHHSVIDQVVTYIALYDIVVQCTFSQGELLTYHTMEYNECNT